MTQVWVTCGRGSASDGPNNGNCRGIGIHSGKNVQRARQEGVY